MKTFCTEMLQQYFPLNDWYTIFVNCTHFGSLFLLVHVPAGKGPNLTQNWIPIALDLNSFCKCGSHHMEERLTDWEHGPPLKITDHDFKNFFKIW